MTSEQTLLYRAARRKSALGVLLLTATALLGAGCAGLPLSEPSAATHGATASPRQSELAPYVELIERLASGDADRQAKAVNDALAAATQSPTAGNRLRYAIALGAAGRPDSNPVEARRLIAELLAGQHDLKPQEIALANAYLREFDARMALYAEIARQRDESEQRVRAAEAEADRRADALGTENARLKKALAEAERKLEAVAEMERSLLEQSKQKP